VTDSQLIREIKDGRVELYGELIAKYETKILFFISAIIKNTQIENNAEDLCQETFYKAYRNLKNFRGVDSSFSTWLFAIARNTVMSELRKLKSLEILFDEDDSFISVPDSLPENELLKHEKLIKVREAINKLPERQRSAIILREYEQMDYTQIAVVLESTVSSVKSLLNRARATIKLELEPYILDYTKNSNL